MAAFEDFVGTWHADRGAPYSRHTFVWEHDGAGLRGRWLIEAAESEAARAAAAAGRQTRFDMQIGEPWMEEDCLLFHVNGGPVISEFRLLGANEAVVGAALTKLPPELTGPEFQRSIEGHRVRLRRQTQSAE
jgi:hypothetical protein